MPANDTSFGAFLPSFPARAISAEDFVSINSDGNFSVNGKPIRFWGTNLVSNAACPDKDKAYYIAGRMRKLGINLVRFHQLDAPMNIRSLLFGGSSSRQLNLANLDYMDKLISELKKNGIYVNMNLNVVRKFQAADGIPDADSLQHFAKGFTIFAPQIIALEKEYAMELLTHVNPYTGLSLAEDPVMAMVELTNENSLYIMWRQNELKPFASGGILPVRYNKMLDTMFNSFLMNKYHSTANLEASWGNSLSPSDTSNLIINGDFENPSNANWYMELYQGAMASMSRETLAPYQGKMSAKVTVTAVSGTDWHIQFEQTGFSLKKDSVYVVEFAARSDSSRAINATVMRTNSPYNGYGNKDFSLSSQWQTCSFTIKATEDNIAQSRFSINFKNNKGIFWFDNIKVMPSKAKGLLAGERLEDKTVKRIDYNDAYAYSAQRVKDISEFYIKLQDDFYSDMKNYLKNQLHVRVPIVGNNFNSGPGDLISQEKYDYIDNHAYWQHPVFPGVPWSATDWTVANTPMVKALDGGTMTQLFGGIAMLGKPYTVSEYDHPFPNQFQTEMMLFTSAYLSFHNADAIEFFDYNASLDFDTDFIAKHFDNSRNAALMSLSPSCALAYRNNYISKALETIKISYSPDFVYILPGSSKANARGISFYPTALSFLHTIRNESFQSQATTDFSKLPAAPQSPYKTDTGEILFDPQKGILTVSTPMFVGAAGFLNSNAGTKAGLMEITSADGFATLTWVSLTGDSLVRANRSLITVSSKAQNTLMTWDGTTTVHNDWGHTPTQICPLRLGLRLNINADSIRVTALNVYGNPLKQATQVYYPVTPGVFEVTLDENTTRSPWFGVERFSEGTSSIAPGPKGIQSYKLEQNYPNPFNGITSAKYYVPYESKIKIDIFDALGRKVKSLFDQTQPRGIYTIRWEGKDDNNETVPSGVYFMCLKAGSYVEIKKLVMLK
ncbi:MAG TPA: carbohydrate binding domain-containing protein [Ignavibacteriales bacterium]|nr:carbohydrate binding domain-containing protein [Ignavibacteriales bacterium]